MYTGSASSVIGLHPVQEKGFIYRDSYSWVDVKTINKPNEKAKYLAEKVCWNAIKKQDHNPSQTSTSKTTLITLLPYFMLGPPLYHNLIETNSSCSAMNSILTN